LLASAIHRTLDGAMIDTIISRAHQSARAGLIGSGL
jgi:hypothetical protein